MKRLQELKKKAAAPTEEFSGKQVTLFIQSTFFDLTGSWYWDLYADTVLCSDVMLTTPTDFRGTAGIIHPDDIADLKEKLFRASKTCPAIQFRIITTYGEIREL